MKKDMEDKLAIRELIDNWAVWRDSFQWDRFRTVWHPEGRMWATWFQGTYEEFIEAEPAGLRQGRAHLSLPRRLLDRHQGQRAPSPRPRCRSRSARRSKAWNATCSASAGSTISWKSARANGGWCWRRLTYEKDQIVPVDPTKAPKLDPKLLARFPVGYRHLAYLQTKVGYKVKDGHAGRRRTCDRRALRAGRELAQGRQRQEDRVVTAGCPPASFRGARASERTRNPAAVRAVALDSGLGPAGRPGMTAEMPLHHPAQSIEMNRKSRHGGKHVVGR